MKKFSFAILLLLLLNACSHAFVLYDVEADQKQINAAYEEQDQEIESMITPYREDLSSTMNKTIAQVDQDLIKAKPSSSLGNLLADASLEMAKTYTKSHIDMGIMNYGGIRLPGLNKGPLTIGTVYELMPFDNYLLVLNLNGEQVQSMLDAIAANGGWPVSGVQFVIKDNAASNIFIQGEAIENTKNYRVAISDYLANGGDHMDMLKGLPQENTNVLLRDAFLDYFRSYGEQNKALPFDNEMRIGQ